ncbi:uncharacterized protein BX663DRAFT_70320 [Cokeromyces recurvatus]|uniref:uncharacterized protein n=1 Tax=Cokeromyces recurvatus TaxID=90255 RepID=UPI00221F8C85|nr:uncharacterized protein BX663DRAFT_70320 [Cokeromyces recurvatus]KAI7902798.1 hypothetical protein BX663DRAFT_70320 [Cokeromyces recurvatus]
MTTESANEQFNVQWDVLHDSTENNNTELVNPLSNNNADDPAILTSQNYQFDSSHFDIDISDKVLLQDNNNNNNNNTIILDKKIQILEPKKEIEEQQNTFISYLVVSNKAQVRRRFQDFVWLHNVLYTQFPACFVPPLPDKHRLEYVKGDRFGSEFIEKRRLSLEIFIQRIARHPILSHSEVFTMFLESSEFNDASARALREGQETMIDTISDSLLNAFSKIRKPEIEFVEMKERNERIYENLDLLQKTLLRTCKRTEDLCHDYERFTASVRELAEIEPSFKDDLKIFADGLETYTSNLKDLTAKDHHWQIEVHDTMVYYNTIQEVLKLRDQKQLDFEDLSAYLQNTVIERERTIQQSNSVTDFITNKINEVRGADIQKLKREKVLKLDERVRELQDAIHQTFDVSKAFSDQVRKEDKVFNHNKSVEIYHALHNYTDAKVNFYQDSVNIWKEVVHLLEEEKII